MTDKTHELLEALEAAEAFLYDRFHSELGPAWHDGEAQQLALKIMAAKDTPALATQPQAEAQRGVGERQRNDIGILIAMIESLEEATGEGPEEEDGVIFAQIKRSHNQAIADRLTPQNGESES